MVEVLAGRLKWERIGDGVRVEFPRQFHRWNNAWDKVPGFIWLLIILDQLSNSLAHGSSLSGMRPAFDIAAVMGFFILVLWLIWRLMEKVSLILDRDTLKIQTRSFGITASSRTLSTRCLHNLRLGRSTRFPSNKKFRPDEIQIDEDYKSIVLARGVKDEEASALIECMLRVYAFPKYLPSESDCSRQGPPGEPLTLPR